MTHAVHRIVISCLVLSVAALGSAPAHAQPHNGQLRPAPSATQQLSSAELQHRVNLLNRAVAIRGRGVQIQQVVIQLKQIAVARAQERSHCVITGIAGPIRVKSEMCRQLRQRVLELEAHLPKANDVSIKVDIPVRSYGDVDR